MKIVPFIIAAVVATLGVLGLTEIAIPGIQEAIVAYEIDAIVTTQNVVHAVGVYIITGLATVATLLGATFAFVYAVTQTNFSRRLSLF